MTDTEAFDDSGMVVLRAAVEPELCGRVREALRPWGERHPHPGDRLQDAWRRNRSVRDLACHPRIMAELRALYGRRPMPFQTLNFSRGSEQPLHADSVHFDSIPSGWMCGVWVALEAVGDDQGPLDVVPGSQLTAPAAFEEIMRGEAGFDMAAYERLLAQRLAASPAEPFHAAAGDVLIWHADLAHGGATIGDRSSTRWSQVTHYFFDGFSYETPLRQDRRRGTVHLRDPLVDIGTGRIVVHRVDGERARVVRMSQGRSVVLRAGAARPSPVVRSVSAARRMSLAALRRTKCLVEARMPERTGGRRL